MTSEAYGPLGFRECQGDYRAEADLEPASQPLYRFQPSLPRLPVPSLDATVAQYLATLVPLVAPAELEQSKALAREFLRPGGMGETLQRRLQARASERSDTSFLAEWWNTLGYLQVRDPVVFNVSYFFHFADSSHAEQRSPIGRAAALLRGSMEFRALVASGKLEPEQLGAKKTPVCATAYKYMFNACRIPRRGSDTYRIFDPATHNHVVVMRRNRFFRLEMLTSQGKVLSFQQLTKQLEIIVQLADTDAAYTPALGALTAEDRDVWADAREELLGVGGGNDAALRVIESAVLVLNLDVQAPVTRSEVARALWHGDGRNRWFDKCVQLAVFANGKAGLLGEHSMLDGMPMARFADYLLSRLARKQLDMGSDHSPPTRGPQQLRFQVSTATLAAVDKAEKTFDATVADHEVHVESFYGYGSRAIKQMRVSPDAFAQMAIQLAYKKLFKQNAATYEASQTRIFLHGRTETTRSCSKQSAAFTDAMVDGTASAAPRELKRKLLLDAASAHVAYMRKAAQGLGVDRHLLALRLLVQPEERVAFFEDPAMAKSRYWLISTSHLTNELFDGWGWGEVVPEGLGIAYSIKDRSVQFNIACRQHGGWAGRMGHLLEESLVEMQQLFDEDAKPQSKL